MMIWIKKLIIVNFDIDAKGKATVLLQEFEFTYPINRSVTRVSALNVYRLKNKQLQYKSELNPEQS